MSDPKRYKIMIVEIGAETKIEGKEWEQGAGEATPDNGKAYGYTPEIEKICDYSRTIFEQTVESLDLSAVVSVINNIPPPSP